MLVACQGSALPAQLPGMGNLRISLFIVCFWFAWTRDSLPGQHNGGCGRWGDSRVGFLGSCTSDPLSGQHHLAAISRLPITSVLEKSFLTPAACASMIPAAQPLPPRRALGGQCSGKGCRYLVWISAAGERVQSTSLLSGLWSQLHTLGSCVGLQSPC